MKKIIKIPYGRNFLSCSINKKNLIGILGKEDNSLKGNVNNFIKYKIDHPINGVRLEDFISKKDKVLIVIPDLTRYAYVDIILPILLKYLNSIGISKQNLEIIVATGLHRTLSDDELIRLVGSRIFNNFKVYNHSQKNKDLIKIGYAKKNIPVVLNKRLTKVDSIITIGVVEPHLYAGYSGGAKTVAIGLGGEVTITATHNPIFLDNKNTKIGEVKNNPFQAVLSDIAKRLPIKFAINVLNDPKGNLNNIFTGRLNDVYKNAVIYADRLFRIKVKKKADIVICGIGYPKDVNLYQASRAINYILNVDRPILKRNGVIILAASLDEGFGEGSAEIRFKEILENVGSMKELKKRIKKEGCSAGEHRAYMVAKVFDRAKIIFVTKHIPAFKNGGIFLFFKDMDEAISYALHLTGKDSKACIIPKALSIIASL